MTDVRTLPFARAHTRLLFNYTHTNNIVAVCSSSCPLLCHLRCAGPIFDSRHHPINDVWSAEQAEMTAWMWGMDHVRFEDVHDEIFQ